MLGFEMVHVLDVLPMFRERFLVVMVVLIVFRFSASLNCFCKQFVVSMINAIHKIKELQREKFLKSQTEKHRKCYCHLT